ncbi:MAG: RdgB/HAM1 family non-canonical purine NTP pyrophosphatase [Mucilaginibacter sp.]|nr:RdgB/HAM1 family non-canonical purine NTP pyrophosphatase [Mucilaginibacter sp.]
MQQLVFATNNKHKLAEVAAKVGAQFKLVTLDEIGCHDDIAETGHTFHENASIKSHYIFEHFGLNCFGDDSGLEIDALNGEPGIYSARYSGQHGDHDANNKLVLQKMYGETNRKARFRSVISLMWNGEEHFFDGVVEGSIRQELSGVEGFGYDPIFEPEEFDITLAEMTMDEKNAISHRGQAVDKLVAFLTAQQS